MIIAKISLNENRGNHQSLSMLTIRKVENAKKSAIRTLRIIGIIQSAPNLRFIYCSRNSYVIFYLKTECFLFKNIFCNEDSFNFVILLRSSAIQFK